MIVEKWKQCDVYVIGQDHSKAGGICQDRTSYSAQDGVHVIALADGAGSKQKSEIGAFVVTRKITEILSQDFSKIYMSFEQNDVENIKNVKKELLNTLLQDLNARAISENVPLSELASTFLFFALYKDKYIMGHIGDGVIGGLFEEDKELVIKTLSKPENGGAPNITFFITDTNALEHFRLSAGTITDLRGVILMSDGPEEAFYHKRAGLHEHVIRIFENFKLRKTSDYREILSKFLSDKVAQYSSDDLSLNLLYLERVNTHETESYAYELLKGITSKRQIIPISSYCFHLDSTIKAKTEDFTSIDEVRSYLKWM